MDKKTYNKPELKTRKIELGVFGDYGNNNGNNKENDSGKTEIIGHLGLRME